MEHRARQGLAAIVATTHLTLPVATPFTSAPGSFVQVADFGAFTKQNAGTRVRISWTGTPIGGNAFACQFQLRVDGNTPPTGDGTSYAGTGGAPGTDGGFSTTADVYDLSGLSAGAHEITVWIRQVGVGSCVLQAGGYGASLYVDELS